MKTSNLVGLLVLLFIVVTITLAAMALGVDRNRFDIAFGTVWFVTAVFTYYYVCIRNRDRFVLYTKLYSKGGKGPGLFEKSIMFFFGPYFLWSHGVWPKLVSRFQPKPIKPRKNV
jgi:hypothetical protein